VRTVENKGKMGKSQYINFFNFLFHYKQATISSVWVSYRLIQTVFFDLVAKSVEVFIVAVNGSVLVLVVKWGVLQTMKVFLHCGCRPSYVRLMWSDNYWHWTPQKVDEKYLESLEYGARDGWGRSAGQICIKWRSLT